MRLTLRTLLAWMDDTLDPDQVKEIGKQVGESPFARELTDRINRVTRQRRLSVPGRSGPDGTDPNTVASYLDNDLDADAVAEFEKRCLTSDVNLAEVASVHQILSLLGQKVKVPDAARNRMYQLVKGREAIVPRRDPAARPAVKEPVTRPIQPWVTPPPPARPLIERFGPAAACVLLIVLMSWAARESLRMPLNPAQNLPPVAPGTQPGPEAEGGPAAAGAGDLAANEAAVKPGPEEKAVPEPPTPEPAEAAKIAKAADAEKVAAAEKAKPAPVVPEGSAGLAEKPDGILLRYNDDARQWDRIVKETSLKSSDRILNLEPFRSAVDVGKLRLSLTGETEVRVLSGPTAPEPAVELLQGRLAIRQPTASTLKLTFARQTATIELSSDSVVGIERVPLVAPGQPVTQPASLGILCQQGEVKLEVGGKRETLKALSTALVSPGGDIQTGQRPSLPPWVAQAEPSEYQSQVKDQFLKLFHADRPVLAEVVAAVEDERAEIKPLAVAALQALGDLSLLMPTLSRPNDPVARRATIAAIREYMVQGPDASGRVRAALDEEFGQDLGGLAQHMLIGYTQEEASRPDLYARLVDLLSPEQDSVGLRELALDTLRRITGRDSLGYDPDRPAGRGFEAWNDLAQRNALRPAAPAAPRTRTQR